MISAKFVRSLFVLLAMSASGAALAEQQSVLSVAGKRFLLDGRGIDADHQRRMERILRECAQRQMVVIVGIFYQRVQFGLEDQQAMRRAVRTVTERLVPHRNAVITLRTSKTRGVTKAWPKH